LLRQPFRHREQVYERRDLAQSLQVNPVRNNARNYPFIRFFGLLGEEAMDRVALREVLISVAAEPQERRISKLPHLLSRNASPAGD
jgi:hypothetical protein